MSAFLVAPLCLIPSIQKVKNEVFKWGDVHNAWRRKNEWPRKYPKRMRPSLRYLFLPEREYRVADMLEQLFWPLPPLSPNTITHTQPSPALTAIPRSTSTACPCKGGPLEFYRPAIKGQIMTKQPALHLDTTCRKKSKARRCWPSGKLSWAKKSKHFLLHNF